MPTKVVRRSLSGTTLGGYTEFSLGLRPFIPSMVFDKLATRFSWARMGGSSPSDTYGGDEGMPPESQEVRFMFQHVDFTTYEVKWDSLGA